MIAGFAFLFLLVGMVFVFENPRVLSRVNKRRGKRNCGVRLGC